MVEGNLDNINETIFDGVKKEDKPALETMDISLLNI